jgi:hypothetical protein
MDADGEGTGVGSRSSMATPGSPISPSPLRFASYISQDVRLILGETASPTCEGSTHRIQDGLRREQYSLRQTRGEGVTGLTDAYSSDQTGVRRAVQEPKLRSSAFSDVHE